MAETDDMLNYESCWDAVERRDAARDGSFYFGVITTGVYCRPSCAARRPLRQNVRFYRTPDEAERDGLRACLRCRPLETGTSTLERMQELCRYIEAHLDPAPDLAALAAQAGMSRFHLQRTFKSAIGLTPKQYADACRLKKLKQELRTAPDVTAAVYEAGFGSGSRVYERSDARLGMTPGQYRKSGNVAISYAAVPTTLGFLMIGATDRGICFVQFGDTEAELVLALRAEFPAAEIAPMVEPASEEFGRWVDALQRHLEGSQPQLDLPLDIRATAFRMRVWNYLQSIPYGEVRSYAEVAAGIGSPSAVRAVASACASNRIALAIPCHRVIRGTGEPGGYRWGIDRKLALLEREKQPASLAI